MLQIRERVGKLLDYLKEEIYPQKVEISSYKMLHSAERFQDVKNLDTSAWEDFSRDEVWGGHEKSYWFDTIVSIPEQFAGKCVVFEVKTGREGNWDAINPQFSLYVDGVLRQGLDVNHRECILTECAEAGKSYRITMSAFTGTHNYGIKLESALKVLDRQTEKYYYDLMVPYETAKLLNPEDQAAIRIIQALNESLNLLDFRKEGSEAYHASMKEAQEYLTRNFYEKYGDAAQTPVVYCVGHTHIDCAWLWTLSVTEDKAVRSFSTVIELMKQYPEYIFMSSQPQLYKYVKKNAPEIYAQIKERVKEGRWEPEGGMFVEADCNITSGESFVRQFMHGQRFFKEEFGVDNKILWLPDVFGYSAALPQIMQKCGIPYFMTTKISWNEFNKMPYDTFLWEGIDGTRVLTHFIPTREYDRLEVEGSERTQHFTTYNAEISPSQMKGAWKRYSQKYLNEEVLCSYGFGDGGGGPTREMLEIESRLSKGIPGVPRTRPATAGEFFRTLDEHVRNQKYLPVWNGELYLEYHRGTYTSMARNKKYNRKSELAYQNEEFFASMDHVMGNGSYPKKELYDGWEVILRNQFHDILPGSSIQAVYEDSKAEYEKILKENRNMTKQTLEHLTGRIDAPKGSLVVYNPNGFGGSYLVLTEITEDMQGKAFVLLDGEKEIEVQRLSDGKICFFAEGMPSKGYKTFGVKEVDPFGAVDAAVRVGFAEKGMFKEVSGTPVAEMENAFFKITFNEKGQFAGIYDKKAEREILKSGQAGNVIVSYEDRPHNYDAWDVNVYYKEKSWEVDALSEMELVENGSVMTTVKLVRPYLDSTITQYISMYKDVPRIDIRNVVDWKEHQIFLKDYFPVDVHANETTYEIQYGNVTRANHDNTSWDSAKFEVCHHKWLDLSEEGYGVSVLNDCKFGASVRDGVIGMSMLKGAIYPNPAADKEMHEFTYSIYPHEEGWRAAGTVREAYALNNPVQAFWKMEESSEKDLLPDVFSMVSVNKENIAIEVVKEAEDSKDTIIRLYEYHNRRTPVTMTLGKEIAFACECNMMEEDMGDVSFGGNTISFVMKPYEIKTIRVRFK